MVYTIADLAEKMGLYENKIMQSEIMRGFYYKAFLKYKKCGDEWNSMVYSKTQGHGCNKM